MRLDTRENEERSPKKASNVEQGNGANKLKKMLYQIDNSNHNYNISDEDSDCDPPTQIADFLRRFGTKITSNF